MNRYTKKLRTTDAALEMFRRYSIDAVSKPVGYKEGRHRKLSNDHGDFSEFHQSIIEPSQKIAYISLKKKLDHRVSPYQCGAAGSLEMAAFIASDSGGVPAYFLPWDERGGTMQLTIPKGDGDDLNSHPQLFFTAALSGCSILIKGSADHPTIIHAGSGQLPIPYDANKFWKNFVEHLDSNPDPAIRDLRQRKPVQSQATKSQYVTGLTVHDPSALGGQYKSTQRALDFQKILKHHYGDTIEIVDIAPWGAVFGIRSGPNWTFYLQESANISYYPTRKIQQVMEYVSGDPVFLPDKVVRAMGPMHIVSRPMALRQFFPVGSGTAKTRRRWRSLLRTDPLNDLPNAYPTRG